jgi:hypothetical protein
MYLYAYDKSTSSFGHVCQLFVGVLELAHRVTTPGKLCPLLLGLRIFYTFHTYVCRLMYRTQKVKPCAGSQLYGRIFPFMSTCLHACKLRACMLKFAFMLTRKRPASGGDRIGP